MSKGMWGSEGTVKEVRDGYTRNQKQERDPGVRCRSVKGVKEGRERQLNRKEL